MEQMTNPISMGSTMLLYMPKEGWYRYWPLQDTDIHTDAYVTASSQVAVSVLSNTGRTR